MKFAQRLVLGIDGNVCAGKTSVIRRLAYERRFNSCAEYWELMTQRERQALSERPPDERLNLLLEVEAERRSALIASPRPIVLDRTILTLLVTHFALAGPQATAGIEQVGRALRRTSYLRPSHFIFLDVPYEVQLERWRERGGQQAIYIDPDFCQAFRAGFLRLAGILPLTFISYHGQSTSEIVLEIISSLRATSQTYSLSDAIKFLWQTNRRT